MREQSAYLRCEKQKIRERMKARLADGALIDVATEQVKLPLKFLDFDSLELLYVIDMNYRYDIILGIPWLKVHEPWVNWRTGEVGNSRPADPEVGSWKDQHLFSIERQAAQESVPNSLVAVDGGQASSPIQHSNPSGYAAETCQDDKLTDISPTVSSHQPTKRSRQLSFHGEDELPLVQARQSPTRREPLVSRRDSLEPDTVEVAPPRNISEACEGDDTRHPSVSTSVVSDTVKHGTRHRLVEFNLEPITDLPKSASSLLALECIPYQSFLKDLKAGAINEIVVLQVEPTTVDVAAATVDTDSKKARFNSQNWEKLKDNPAYSVLREYQDVFPDEVPSRLPVDKGIRHEIDLEPGTKYCVTRQWPLPREQVEAIDAHFAKALAAGRVRESISPHSAPTFCVKKATGGWRIVHAYNKLNAATIPAQTPIPRRDTVIDAMNGCSRFSAIDLTDGYYQLLMRESDISRTACSTPSGMLWEWLVMPQGLKNAPATFNRLVTHLFRPLRKYAQTYFDDIFIHSRERSELSDIEAHNEDLRQVLQCMRENALYANLKKCVFSATEIPVLGCFVGKDGVRADPEKVRAVSEWPTPRNVKDLRKWLGLANYLHRFSKNYAALARPLTTLLKKDVPFNWTKEHDDAFNAIKQSLMEAPILDLPNFDTPFWVVCDASDYAIGCALLQHDGDGNERVISYQSRALKAAEKNYPVHDKELLAMKYALVKFRVYLLGSRPFVIYTDHASLRTATQSPHLSQRMARWLSFFAEYNFTVAYKPGRENILADALSRRPDYDPKEMDQIMGISVVGTSLYDDIRAAYADDEQCKALVEHFNAGSAKPVKLQPANEAVLHRYSYRDRLLLYRVHPSDTPRIVIPSNEQLRARLIYEFHDTPISGHVGREKTYAALSEHYYWRRMYKHVQRYVRLCEVCQQVKSSPSQAAPLQSLPVPNECWTDVSLDFIFGFPTDRNRYNGILVFVDRLSKMVHLVACSKNITGAKTAHHFLDHVFKHHGMPERLVSDRDPRFTGNFWTEVFHRLGTRLNMSTAAHPESDGQTERANRVVEDMLRCFCAKFPSQWSSLLPLVEFAMNNSVHASTGYTPFFLNNLRDPRIPATLSGVVSKDADLSVPTVEAVAAFLDKRHAVIRFVRDHMAAAQDMQKQSADKHGRKQKETFVKGDLVYLNTKNLPQDAMLKHMRHDNNKLYPRFVGPFAVTAVISPTSYRLELPAAFNRVHPVFYVGLLKRDAGAHLNGGMISENPQWISLHQESNPRPPVERQSPPQPNLRKTQSDRLPSSLRAEDAAAESTACEPCDGQHHALRLSERKQKQPAKALSQAPPEQRKRSRSTLSSSPSFEQKTSKTRGASIGCFPSSSDSSSRESNTPRDASRQPLDGSVRPPEALQIAPRATALPDAGAQKEPSPLSEPLEPCSPLRPASPKHRSWTASGVARSHSADPSRADRAADEEVRSQAVATEHVPQTRPSPSRRQASSALTAPVHESVTGVPPSPPEPLSASGAGTLRRQTHMTTPPESAQLNSQDVPSELRDDQRSPAAAGHRSMQQSSHRSDESGDAPATIASRVGRKGNERKQCNRIATPGQPTRVHPAERDTALYSVDHLVRRRLHRDQVQYLVHWEGYSVRERTWEPRDSLMEDCPQIVEAYEQRRNASLRA